MEPEQAVESLRETLPAELCDSIDGLVKQGTAGIIDEMHFAITLRQICKGIPNDKREDPVILSNLQDIYSGVMASYEKRYAPV
jgi:hypothetical protein